MKAIKLIFALMFSIAPICPHTEEISSTEMCADSSGCPVQASSEEATDDNLIEKMAGLLDSVGGDTFEGGEAAQYTVKENMNTGQEENVTWWEKLERTWKHLFSFGWDQMKKELPEWVDEVRMKMADWVEGWSMAISDWVEGWSMTISDWVEGWRMTISQWLHSQGIQLPHFTTQSDDKTTILGVVASTLLLLHVINLWSVRSGRERTFIARLAEMDRRLFMAKNEALISKRDGDVVKQGQFDEIAKEKDTKIVESRLALEQALADCEQIKDEYGQAVQAWKGKCEELTGQVEESMKEKMEADEMMEEMLQYKNRNEDGQRELLEIVEKLQDQLKGQNNLLGKYEPMLKEKEKTIRELGKESKRLKIHEANARLELDKVRKELSESRAKVDPTSKTETDWKTLSDLLQSQIDEKMVTEDNLLTEVGNLKSKLAIFKSEAEANEEQLEELKELVLVLESKKEDRMTASDGWDLGEECDLEDAMEVARLRVHVKKMEASMIEMEREMTETQTKWDNIQKELLNLREENKLNQTLKEEAVKEREDTVRKLDVLTEFFNKKETELQKELGIQCAKFDHLSTDAETANKKLVATMSELEATQATLKIIKRELEEQEVSLKASLASEEKRAYENWVTARQAERKLADHQSDLELLRNRITTIEAENYALVQRNEELQKMNDQLPAASDSEVSTMNGAQNGFTIEADQNGRTSNESLSNGVDYVKIKSESINEYTNFNRDPSFPSEPLFSEVKHVNQSVPIQPSLPPLPGLKSFTSPPSHLPGLPSLPGLSLPSLLPSLPGMTTLPNTTIPIMDRRSKYKESVTDGRPPSHRDSLTDGRPPSHRDSLTDGRPPSHKDFVTDGRPPSHRDSVTNGRPPSHRDSVTNDKPPSNTPKSRKYSPEYDRVSSSTSHCRSYSPAWRASSRMLYEGDSPPGFGRHHSTDRLRHGSPGRLRHGSPGRSRHGSPDRSHDGPHSRGDRRTYHRQSPTRSHHERDRGMPSREGSSDGYDRGESGRKKDMGSNGKSFNAPDRTFSTQDHTDQFRNLI